jgi:hypothetical protein
MSQQELFPGLVKANPFNCAGRNLKLSRRTDRDGYHTVYEIKNGKKRKLGAVGNAAGLRWLAAMAR